MKPRGAWAKALRTVKAVILAGGRGRRLAPFTVAFPKPLVPVGDHAVLELLVRSLARSGIREVTFAVDHLAELIMAYVEGHPGLRGLCAYRFARDERPSGTAGPLRMIPGLEDTFLVCNGDLLTTLDFTALVAHHRGEGAALTVAVHRKAVRLGLGVLDIDPSGSVTRYQEKPQLTYDVSMGVYVYEPRALSRIAPGEYLDFPDLVQRLLQEGERVAAYRTDAYWLDVGNPEDYARAQEDAAAGLGPVASLFPEGR
ncbi:MAG: NTP transferase domain-containing protein [Deltaproteobacteria bacterium]|nr:NTP transferase domain-containing protein [Deltaproteobacteria bacterium]